MEARGLISIHAPLAGSDRLPAKRGDADLAFQSTLPSRGATKKTVSLDYNNIISIHAPLAGSDYDYGSPGTWAHISIHAPLAGSDNAPL